MNPRHSIIIPHRGRETHLRVCLRSIEESRRITGITNYELLIVGADQPQPVFNKSQALNEGIVKATGDVLTFLDCDAIVGPRWLESVERETFTQTQRLCYRVKRISVDDSSDLLEHGYWYRDALYDEWDGLHTAYEHHRLWEPLPAGLKQAPLGNSQFSITRDALGDARYDESYQGYGYEDLSFILRLYRAHDGLMRDRLVSDKDHAMMHLSHRYDPKAWRHRTGQLANKTRFLRQCKEAA